jgi:hypothetical protein
VKKFETLSDVQDAISDLIESTGASHVVQELTDQCHLALHRGYFAAVNGDKKAVEIAFATATFCLAIAAHVMAIDADGLVENYAEDFVHDFRRGFLYTEENGDSDAN